MSNKLSYIFLLVVYVYVTVKCAGQYLSEANPPNVNELQFVEGVISEIKTVGKGRSTIRIKLIDLEQKFQYGSNNGSLNLLQKIAKEGNLVRIGFHTNHGKSGLLDFEKYYIVLDIKEVGGSEIGFSEISTSRLVASRFTLVILVFFIIVGITAGFFLTKTAYKKKRSR